MTAQPTKSVLVTLERHVHTLLVYFQFEVSSSACYPVTHPKPKAIRILTERATDKVKIRGY
jgi:hypothetical protein